MLQIQTQLLPPCGIYKVSLSFSLWDQFVFSSKIRIDWKNPPNSVCRFVKLVPPCLFISNLCNVRCVVYCKSDQFEWGNSVYPYTHMYGDTHLVKVRRHSHWWPIKLGSFQLKILIQFDKHQSKQLLTASMTRCPYFIFVTTITTAGCVKIFSQV